MAADPDAADSAGRHPILGLLRTAYGTAARAKLVATAAGRREISTDGAQILALFEQAAADTGVTLSFAQQHLIKAAKAQETLAGDGTTTVALLGAFVLARAAELPVPVPRVVRGLLSGLDEALAFIRSPEMPSVDLAGASVREQLCVALGTKLRDAPLDTVVALLTDALARADSDITRIRLHTIPGAALDESLVTTEVLLPVRAVPDAVPATPGRLAVLSDAQLAGLAPPTRVSTPEELVALDTKHAGLLEAQVDRWAASGVRVVAAGRELPHGLARALASRSIVAAAEVPDKMLADLRAAGSGEVRVRTLALSGGPTFVGIAAAEPAGVTVVLRSYTMQACREAARHCQDALCTVRNLCRDGRALPGGGAPELAMAARLRRTGDVVWRALADALEDLVHTLCTNAGLDADAFQDLRRRHAEGDHAAGVSAGGVHDVAWAKEMALQLAVRAACDIEQADVAVEASGP